MCGIIGAFYDELTDSSHRRRFNFALEQLEHRGPDALGKKTINLNGKDLIFGHTRLSIIDLSNGWKSTNGIKR